MTYSCVDFTDDILSALNVTVPEEHWDNPSRQADIALAKIHEMQCELGARRAGWTFDEPANEYRLHDYGDGSERIDANKTWAELCTTHNI